MTVFTIRYGANKDKVMVLEEKDPNIAAIIHKHLSDNVGSGEFTFGVAYFIGGN